MPTRKLQSNHIIAPDNCTGCGLCANLCPKASISMLWDDEGFLKPNVDATTCIDCGICVKQCPALKEVEFIDPSLDEIVAYGAWNANIEIRESSSSGGIFTALSNFVFQHGGCVFGVVWENATTAVFKKAENLSELAPMRGSIRKTFKA